MVNRQLDALRAGLEDLGRVVVAFSGGVDSSLLAFVAADTLGPDALAATAVSPSLARRELAECESLARDWGLRWTTVATDELTDARYQANDLDRCYWCKDALMEALLPLADEATITLGVNVDDLADHRPGQKAAAARGARFPLVEAGFDKAWVRATARDLGLAVWDKPAAPCLASRLPYGTEVTLGRLAQVERAEAAVRDLGFRDVRVRHHGELARVEVPADELDRAVAHSDEIVDRVSRAGYRWVTLDLQGLRSGNLNPR